MIERAVELLRVLNMPVLKLKIWAMSFATCFEREEEFVSGSPRGVWMQVLLFSCGC